MRGGLRYRYPFFCSSGRKSVALVLWFSRLQTVGFSVLRLMWWFSASLVVNWCKQFWRIFLILACNFVNLRLALSRFLLPLVLLLKLRLNRFSRCNKMLCGFVPLPANGFRNLRVLDLRTNVTELKYIGGQSTAAIADLAGEMKRLAKKSKMLLKGLWPFLSSTISAFKINQSFLKPYCKTVQLLNCKHRKKQY